MLRGGSWINNPDNARASDRNRNNPNIRNNNVGFRLCCVSHVAPRPRMPACPVHYGRRGAARCSVMARRRPDRTGPAAGRSKKPQGHLLGLTAPRCPALAAPPRSGAAIRPEVAPLPPPSGLRVDTARR
ncbi:MAG: hypothetical protein AAGA68_25225 [Pseudomonadota bacterium]